MQEIHYRRIYQEYAGILAQEMRNGKLGNERMSLNDLRECCREELTHRQAEYRIEPNVWLEGYLSAIKAMINLMRDLG